MTNAQREAATWRRLAKQFVEKDPNTTRGICWAIGELRLPKSIERRMITRIDAYLAGKTWAYDLTPYLNFVRGFTMYFEDHREARALACLWMAQEAAANIL